MDLKSTLNRDTSLRSDVLLRACPKNDKLPLGQYLYYCYILSDILKFYATTNSPSGSRGSTPRWREMKTIVEAHINTKEGDPKVNGLPSLLFKHSFSDVDLGVKKIAILLRNKRIAVVYLKDFYYL